MKTHIHLIRSTYKERRDVMLKSLREYMPEGVHWTGPKGGLFLWVTLPEGMDSASIFKFAVMEKSHLFLGYPSIPWAEEKIRCG